MASHSRQLSYIQDFPIPLGYQTHEAFYFYNDNANEAFDAFDLFRFYNIYFFHNILEASEVKWSSRMTLCAGTCQLQAPGSCLITLSKPLLQFRSNNELKETLIHEMIHGYLFITNPKACRDNGGHGTEFCEIMKNINAVTGLNITVYHSFHDEVDYFRKHVWKCNGPCQHKKPYYGLVKRAMNRAPGPGDYWWKQHEKECSGQYTKIDGPEFHGEIKKEKAKKRKPTTPVNTLNDFFKKTKKTILEDEIIEIEEEDNLTIPRVYLYLLPNDKSQTNIELTENNEKEINEKVIEEYKDEGQNKKESENKKFPETNKDKNNKNQNRQSGTLFDFFKKAISSEDTTETKETRDSFSNFENSFQPRTNLNERNSYPPTIENSKMAIEVDNSNTLSYEKLSNQFDTIFSFLIKKEHGLNSQKFWMRVLINSRNSLTNLLKVSDLISSPEIDIGRSIYIGEKLLVFFNKSLADMNLTEETQLEDRSNGIILRYERKFSLENAKNVNLLKAKHFPVCVGISFFKEDGTPEDDSKERLENMNEMLISIL